jgi:hypothetical protein
MRLQLHESPAGGTVLTRSIYTPRSSQQRVDRLGDRSRADRGSAIAGGKCSFSLLAHADRSLARPVRWSLAAHLNIAGLRTISWTGWNHISRPAYTYGVDNRPAETNLAAGARLLMLRLRELLRETHNACYRRPAALKTGRSASDK